MLGRLAAPLSRCASALVLLPSSPPCPRSMAGLGRTTLLSEVGGLAQGRVTTRLLLAPWRTGGTPSSGISQGPWAPALSGVEGEEREGRPQVVPRAMARSKGSRSAAAARVAPASSRGQGKDSGEAEPIPPLLTPGRHMMDDWSRDWVEKEERRVAQSKADRAANKRGTAPGAERGRGGRVSSGPTGAEKQWGTRGRLEEGSSISNASSTSTGGASFGSPRGTGQHARGQAISPQGALGRGGETGSGPRGQTWARALHTAASRHAQLDPAQLASEREQQALRGGPQELQGQALAPKGLSRTSHVLYAATPAPSPQPKASVPVVPAAPAWNERDAAAVASAMRKAEGATMPRVTGTPSSGAGSDVLLGRSLEELEQLAVELGQQKYRGRQLHQFIYK